VILILKCVGWLLANIPRLAWLMCWIQTTVFILLFPVKLRIATRNLKRAFPEKSYRWVFCTAVISISRTFEGVLLTIALPFISRTKLRLSFFFSEQTSKFLSDKKMHPVIWLVPHFSHTEVLTTLPIYFKNGRVLHAIYRPLKNVKLDTYLKSLREKNGLIGINRKSSLFRSIHVMKSKQILAILFDQNAGKAGSISDFFNLPCSSTVLPEILQTKYNPEVYFVYPRRITFWKSEIIFEPIKFERNFNLTRFSNTWLEQKLKTDKTLRESWLWLHDRWKIRGQVSSYKSYDINHSR